MVIDDVLGLNEQFDKEMDLLVEAYKCEWKEVVSNPDLRKRFTHFVNAPQLKDPYAKFEPMRDQIKAAEWVK